MKANVENFYIFQIEEFLSKIKGYLDVDIDDDSLKDIIKSTKENWVNRLKRLNNSDSSLYSMQLENMHDSIYDFDEKFNNEEIYNQIIKNHFENSIKKNIMDDNKYLDFWYDLSLGRKIKEMAENYSSDFEENKIINSESKDNLIVDENYYKHKSIKEFMDKQSKLDKISKEKYQKMINNKNMKKMIRMNNILYLL